MVGYGDGAMSSLSSWVLVWCRNLVQGYGRYWADELSMAVEGPMLDAAGTRTAHRGWWWLWLLLLLLLFFVAQVLSVFTAVLVNASALPGNSTSVVPSPDLFLIAPMGNVAAVQLSATLIFFQDSTGAIIEGGVTAGKTSGITSWFRIFAINAPNAASYMNVLSEYIYPTTIAQSTNGFMGGPSCTVCLTTQGIVGSSVSQVLYAMANPAFNQFRVGFVSAGRPP
ncbi:hypothetical protein B0H13DRAFT_2442471 [Mycena leptocephala]|nr:hypothetical protein B0H13DRAFT_2442471 [Mycena leptocephala]